MLQGNKTTRPSGLPMRVSRKIPVMTPTRGKPGCLTDAANNNPYSRDQTGSPRNRLGNITNTRNLSQLKPPPKTAAKPMESISKIKCIESGISRSNPDLRNTKSLINPNVSDAKSCGIPKTQSAENLAKPNKNSAVKVKPISKLVSTPYRPSELYKRPKVTETPSKVGADKSRNVKFVENKRKFACLENSAGSSKQKMAATELLSPTAYKSCQQQPKNMMEDANIIKKILLEKKLSDLGSEKGTEFDDTIETFDSDEMVDLFANDLHRKRLENISNDLDKSSKRNSSEFEDSIGSFFSDQMVLNLSKSNEFLNATKHPCNESQLGLSISEDIDNLTPGFSDLSNAIDRTPSVEDLPMECEIEPESGNSTTSRVESTVNARSPSPTEELPLESLSSRTPNAPVSIITSITSIMSLDTGYQGDGELSRPESRNAETELRPLKLPNENGLHVKGINFDDGKTMTDSDFFTESDADVHDDLSAAAAEIGSGKGDRKAQVIDGTLYGGASIQSHPIANPEGDVGINDNVANRLAIVANNSNEDMESSGIYSDLEKKPEEAPPKKESFSYFGLIAEQIKTVQNLALSLTEIKTKPDDVNEGMVKSSSAESSSTVQEAPPAKTTPVGSKKPETEKMESTVKKNKMPNRNVSSKVKVMIETKKDETKAKPKIVKKGKWDAVMDKIAQGKEESKYTPSRFRDVKSKVFENMAPLFSPKKTDSPDPQTVQRGSNNSSFKGRSRRSTRVRSSESSLVSPKLKQSRKSNSPNSSQRSSLSDISVSTTSPHQKAVNRTNKKRESCSPQSNASTNSGNTPTRQTVSNEVVTPSNRGSFRHSDIQNGNVVRNNSATTLSTMKTPPIRKTPPPPRRTENIGPNLQRTPSTLLKDSNQNGTVSKSPSASAVNNNNNKVRSLQPSQTKKPVSRTNGPAQVRTGNRINSTKDNSAVLLNQLRHSNKAFEALAVLLKYCTSDLDAFSTPLLKEKVSELQTTIKNLQDQIVDKEHLITDLKNDNTSLSEESDQFRRLVESLRTEKSDLKVKLGIVEEEIKLTAEQKNQAESELLKEIDKVRHLKREISEKSEKLENEKIELVNRLTETEKEKEVLKSSNARLKEEYDKCLCENQRLANEKVKSERKSTIEKAEILEILEVNGEKFPSATTPGSPEKAKGFVNGSFSSTLESEVNSLQAVLALKTNQVTELRRRLLVAQESADRVPKLVSTITMLEGKVEDLQTQISSQTDAVRDLHKNNEHLEEELKLANIQKTRLTHKNEELQYKLKQYAEAMKQLVSQKNLSTTDIKLDASCSKATPKKEVENGEEMRSQMIGVVEKSDSVSYMLEMPEHTSEIVTNMIRRAESIRSSSRSQTLPKKKRSKTSSIGSVDADSSVGTPKKETFTSETEDFRPLGSSTPTPRSPNGLDFELNRCLLDATRDSVESPMQFSMNKTVKLNQNDFATDSIELTTDNDCEIIEITKNFDKTDKNAEMVTSTSSSISSSSNGSHFDIESDLCSNLDPDQNVQEMDETTESSEVQEDGSIIRTFRRETENIKPVLPIYKDIETNESHSVNENDDGEVKNAFLSSFIKIPKVSGGEAMIGLSSDDEDLDKMK